MQTIKTIGLDIAKSVFQVHGIDAAGTVVVRRQVKRRYVVAFFEKLAPCLIGMEACASAHHWSRQLEALGHTVRLMPPVYVRPYVKRHKNDATDAEAICEAVTRANMRFVPTKTAEQQGGLVLHRTRHLLVRQQTSVINAIRAHLAEFGIVAPVGRRGMEELLRIVGNASDQRLPEVAHACLAALGGQLRMLKAQSLHFDWMIIAWHRGNETSKRPTRSRPHMAHARGGSHAPQRYYSQHPVLFLSAPRYLKLFLSTEPPIGSAMRIRRSQFLCDCRPFPTCRASLSDHGSAYLSRLLTQVTSEGRYPPDVLPSIH